MSDIIKPKIDVAFKKIFTDKDNRDLLKSFISAVLDIEKASIKEMEIRNSEITPEEIEGKFTRFDINMTVDDIIVNIEVQICNQGDFKERSLFYWAQNYTIQLKKGEPYKNLKPTISINIIDFSLFPTDDYHSMFTMYDREHDEMLTDKCELHYFELTKIDNVPDVTDKKKLWMQLINAESEGDLDMLAQTNVKEIQDGVNIVRRFSADDKMRLLAMSREKAMRDEISALYNARAEGMAQGRAEGLAQGMAQGRAELLDALVRRYKERGMSEKEIRELLTFD